MNRPVHRIERLFLPLFTGLMLACGPVRAHQQLPATLADLDARILAAPADLDLRSRRAWLLVDHGLAVKAEEDIRALRADPGRAEEGFFLEATRFQSGGRPKEAKAKLLKSLEGRPIPRKYRLLGEIERDLGHLDAALAAVGQALAKGGGDEEFVLLLSLHRAKGSLPQAVWDMAMESYQGHPAVMEGLYGFCVPMPGGSGRMDQCENMTLMAIATWWPESVDWRLRHARILLQGGKPDKAGPILAEALERLDASAANRRGDQDSAMAKRREAFALMKAAAGPSPARLP
jgi:tetratricopeptide (TPR) repeat protein